MYDQFESERLIAERFQDGHFGWLENFQSNERIMASLGGIKSPKESRQNLDDYITHWDEYSFGHWLVSLKATGEKIGCMGLCYTSINSQCELELAYALSPFYWNLGITTEFCSTLIDKINEWQIPITDLVSCTTPSNTNCRKVMSKLGFRFETRFLDRGLEQVLYRKIM